MANDPGLARELSTRAEFQLISASRGAAIDRLSKQELKSNIARARRLRDKQRDLYQRQRLASQARTGTKHGAAARTKQKAQLFDEALSRFTRRLRSVEAPERRKAKKPAGKGPKPKPRPANAPKRGQSGVLQKARSPRMKSIQAHIGSRGRRRQARRDSR